MNFSGNSQLQTHFGLHKITFLVKRGVGEFVRI